MITFLTRRLLLLIPVAIGVVTIVCLLIHFVPGDPVDQIAGDFATLEDKEELRRSLGLDRSLPEQLMSYFGGILTGDLGHSIIYNKPVESLILERMGPTIELALVSLLVAIVMSLPLGILSAIRAGTPIDLASMSFSLIGVSIPNFWLGPMLILLFALELDWLPVSERGDFSTYILPALTLGTSLAAILTRMTRTSVLENLGEDYVRTARSKGNPERIVLWKHVLRNAALPLVTIVGLQFGVLLTGAIITEKIFDWPGVGTLMLDGIGNRDYPVVQGCVLFFSASYVAVNVLTDLAYAWVDPRIKLEK